jgi:hypothetical protein
VGELPDPEPEPDPPDPPEAPAAALLAALAALAAEDAPGAATRIVVAPVAGVLVDHPPVCDA